MSIEENKALVYRIYEFENRHDVTELYGLTTRDYVLHLTDRDLPREKAIQFEGEFFNEFPDVSATVLDMVAEGDKVFVMVRWRGTQKKSGKKIEMTNANLIRVVNGKWSETWNITDQRLLQQLGVVP